ncbi:Tubulin-tyrosine ligase family [Legionella beliardensis]|uniref:Tubulin-tyrosine ligase family n=1 Tax=Legionella beliardensis TaxID=91822 RepID=A0A378HXG7_9GAMM|nr:tubulin-tyrosine ligase [Legionella beliardensis]STX27597.1 Tubulin-tyrosine ligase family [Legionella beliardensis]
MPNLKPKTFYLQEACSPTDYNLSVHLKEIGWKKSYWRGWSHFSIDNLKFNEQAGLCLEYKHLLACLVQQQCPGAMPLTYCINDDNWPLVLNQLTQQFYLKNNQLSNELAGLIWILKPALLNNGQDIKLFKRLSDLEQHFLSANRLGGEHVLQYYIPNPHLLRDQRKYSIRQFVVLTNYVGAYLYHVGYFNVARQPFSLTISDLRPHLTNEHLHGQEPNVIQIPTDQFNFFKSLYPAIKIILEEVLVGLKKAYPEAFKIQKKATLALFGFDFMVDSQNKVWLLEANHGPCFPTTDDHPLQNYLYKPFWQALISNFVIPIANQDLAKLPDNKLFASLLL